MGHSCTSLTNKLAQTTVVVIERTLNRHRVTRIQEIWCQIILDFSLQFPGDPDIGDEPGSEPGPSRSPCPSVLFAPCDFHTRARIDPNRGWFIQGDGLVVLKWVGYGENPRGDLPN